MPDTFTLAGKTFSSRLLVGTGQYESLTLAKNAVEASGAEIITVSVRRMNMRDACGESMLDVFPLERFTYLPNTAGCTKAEEAVRMLRLAREAGAGTLVKLEVVGDPLTLYPDMNETLRAAHMLVEEGFQVMAYASDDPVFAKLLEAAGCVAVMPLASPIGSGLGITDARRIRYIVESLSIPVLVDAGIGTASDACIAMELGCAGVLLNTAIAKASDPVAMARAMRHAVIAGREAFLAGRMEKKMHAVASSPKEGML